MWWQVLAGLGILAAVKPEATVNAVKSTGAIVATGIKSVANTLEPLGIRLNNPGNIEASASSAWVGEVRPSSHKRYAQFQHPVYGIRALARVLDNYRSLHGLATVRQVITRWAPPSENRTESYIASVAKRTGLKENEDITNNFPAVVAAIIHHENGKQPYSMELINEGIRLSRGAS